MQLDIAFILGGSGNEANEIVRKQKTIVKHMLKSYDVAQGKTHVGVISKTTPAAIKLKIGQIQNQAELYRSIEDMQLSGPTEELLKALQIASDNIFDSSNGGRPGYKNSLVVFVEKDIDLDNNAFKAAKERLKALGVNIIVIDVTSKVDPKKLSQLVPMHNVFFFPPLLDELDMSMYPLVKTMQPGNILYSFFICMLSFSFEIH